MNETMQKNNKFKSHCMDFKYFNLFFHLEMINKSIRSTTFMQCLVTQNVENNVIYNVWVTTNQSAIVTN